VLDDGEQITIDPGTF